MPLIVKKETWSVSCVYTWNLQCGVDRGVDLTWPSYKANE
jgi:hypothetical protein